MPGSPERVPMGCSRGSAQLTDVWDQTIQTCGKVGGSFSENQPIVWVGNIIRLLFLEEEWWLSDVKGWGREGIRWICVYTVYLCINIYIYTCVYIYGIYIYIRQTESQVGISYRGPRNLRWGLCTTRQTGTLFSPWSQTPHWNPMSDEQCLMWNIACPLLPLEILTKDTLLFKDKHKPQPTKRNNSKIRNQQYQVRCCCWGVCNVCFVYSLWYRCQVVGCPSPYAFLHWT